MLSTINDTAHSTLGEKSNVYVLWPVQWHRMRVMSFLRVVLIFSTFHLNEEVIHLLAVF